LLFIIYLPYYKAGKMKNIFITLLFVGLISSSFGQNSKKISIVNFEARIEASCDKIPGIEDLEFSTKCKKGGIEISHLDQKVSGGCSSNILRTVTVTDACGNSKNFEQIIEVRDTEKPKFLVLPPDLTFNNRVEYRDSPHTKFPQVFDNCSSEIMQEEKVYDDYKDGEAKIFKTYIAIDGCGNKATHTQEITFIL